MKKIFIAGILFFALIFASCVRSGYPESTFQKEATIHNTNNIFN